jgi:hypothetical protein
MSEQPTRSYTAIAIAIVIAAVLISASLYVAVEAPTRTTTTTRTVTTTGSSSQTTTTGTSSETACIEIAVNGTGYCSLDVTNNMTFQQFGYSALNAPVTFLGVTFETTCQLNAANCPPEGQNAGQSAGVIPFELIFPDSGIQYLGAFYPSCTCQGQEEYYLTPSETPVAPGTMPGTPSRAGFLLEGASTAPYLRLILLVEPWQQPTPTALANSANNLQLQVYLNSSSPASGFAVSVTVDDYNTLASSNNVTAANDWLVALNGLDGAPCGDDGIVGFAVAEGHYTPSNVTASKFLDLVNPTATYNCPLYLGYGNPTGFRFLPVSDMAYSYGCDQQLCMSEGASTGLTFSGYWDQGGAFVSFPRGTYTVVAEDEWGDSAFTYFSVS